MKGKQVLTTKAIDDFYFLCALSYDYGLISRSEYRERVEYLRHLLSDDGNSLISAEDAEERDPEKLDVESVIAEEELTDERAAEQRKGGCEHIDREAPSETVLQFITIPGHGSWRFNTQDVDTRPSVPHGHRVGDYPVKLNPYDGWIYDRNRARHTRISKKVGRALWNDDKFRQIALDTLKYYVVHHPYYKFDVPHPLRLPRRR